MGCRRGLNICHAMKKGGKTNDNHLFGVVCLHGGLF